MVAVETHDAPSDAEAHAEEAEILAKLIDHGALAAVVEKRPRGAIAAPKLSMARPDCQ